MGGVSRYGYFAMIYQDVRRVAWSVLSRIVFEEGLEG